MQIVNRNGLLFGFIPEFITRPDHLSAATALVARMIGTSAQEDKQMLRQAQIAKHINLIYEDAFQDWQKKKVSQGS